MPVFFSFQGTFVHFIPKLVRAFLTPMKTLMRKGADDNAVGAVDGDIVGDAEGAVEGAVEVDAVGDADYDMDGSKLGAKL